MKIMFLPNQIPLLFRKILTLGLLFLWLPTPSQAIVNIEEMRTLSDQEGPSGEIELALGGASGNTKKQNIDVGARIQRRQGLNTSFAVFRYAYGESNRQRDTERSFFHARNIRKITKTRSEELFVQASQDKFARLTLRALVGGGERFTLVEQPQNQAYLGVGAFYVTETIEARVGTNDPKEDRFWRINTYFSMQYELNTQVSFISTTYYQPALETFSDYRVLEEAALSVKMSERFRLKLSLNLSYDNRPPQTIEKTDTIYSTGLEYRF